MKLWILLFFLLLMSCTPKAVPSGVYFYMPSGWEPVWEEVDQLNKLMKRSKVSLELDEETGNFEGLFMKHPFSGNFMFERQYAGMVKGIYVKSSLGYLQKERNMPKSILDSMATVNRLYFYGDQRVNPRFTVLEIGLKEGDKLLFLKSNR